MYRADLRSRGSRCVPRVVGWGRRRVVPAWAEAALAVPNGEVRGRCEKDEEQEDAHSVAEGRDVDLDHVKPARVVLAGGAVMRVDVRVAEGAADAFGAFGGALRAGGRLAHVEAVGFGRRLAMCALLLGAIGGATDVWKNCGGGKAAGSGCEGKRGSVVGFRNFLLRT